MALSPWNQTTQQEHLVRRGGIRNGTGSSRKFPHITSCPRAQLGAELWARPHACRDPSHRNVTSPITLEWPQGRLTPTARDLKPQGTMSKPGRWGTQTGFRGREEARFPPGGALYHLHLSAPPVHRQSQPAGRVSLEDSQVGGVGAQSREAPVLWYLPPGVTRAGAEEASAGCAHSLGGTEEQGAA